MRATEFIIESLQQTTLSSLYNGNYPDRDETFWDYVSTGELNKPLDIQTLARHKVMITLLGQYRAEHIDDVIDMLDDDRKELVQSYVDDPALSSKVIVLADHRIIDGNHRALAAAIKGVPINYVDLADLEEQEDNLQEYDTSSKSSKQIIAKLKQLGYKLLGSGVDATVWSKDAGSVIKILMPFDNTSADNAFLTFYEFCQRHKSPFLPKFISIGGAHHTVFELDGKQYRQIAMEKLAPLPGGSLMEKMVWALSDLVSVAFIKWADVKKQLVTPDFWEHFPNPGNHVEEVTQALANPQLDKQYAALFTVMQQLYQTGNQHGLGWDLHTENVMARGNTPVITDPYLS